MLLQQNLMGSCPSDQALVLAVTASLLIRCTSHGGRVKNGVTAEIIEKADSINHSMPRYVAKRGLAMVDSSITKPRVLILGVAYKSGVSDVRETPVSELRDYLLAQGAQVAWHDPLVLSWDGTYPVNIEWECDLAILATHQPGIEVGRLIEKGVLVLDCTNTLNNVTGTSSL